MERRAAGAVGSTTCGQVIGLAEGEFEVGGSGLLSGVKGIALYQKSSFGAAKNDPRNWNVLLRIPRYQTYSQETEKQWPENFLGGFVEFGSVRSTI